MGNSLVIPLSSYPQDRDLVRLIEQGSHLTYSLALLRQLPLKLLELRLLAAGSLLTPLERKTERSGSRIGLEQLSAEALRLGV